ncbi:TPA: hypothetical protein RQK43_004285 [Vibrio vulnificus]|uniref:hypothetical protein n=1 Tax=Vibrio vulnificus TaxID=672 RepID=UPI0006986FA3|nr:hypothetical protein [Vibrio vulnificus]EHT4943579.1 hypothetical protein [Vibrio vulnificus]EHZ7344755.1 hypothetical protein [Vibrio vulnificus]MBN8147570.1 hypothetical protein [Vibrio vulnificus]OJI21760.1 hypothetical protein VV99796_03526 [Vibrio vulnificus]OJI47649.1 hypothetical protein VVS316_02709 [Vibrio vulnificus]
MQNKPCPVLIGLTFDEESQEALNAINEMNAKIDDAWVAIALGHLAVIFGGLTVKAPASAGPIEKTFGFQLVSNDVATTSWSIYQTNWEYFFSSFGALERHAKNQISTIAGLQMIRGKISYKERQFWKAVHYGCKVSE